MPRKAMTIANIKSLRPVSSTSAVLVKRRQTTAERGYGGAWQRFSAQFLREHPLCVTCEKDGRIAPATECDHVIPHKGDRVKFWQGPFQGLCESCHARKSAKEKD